MKILKIRKIMIFIEKCYPKNGGGGFSPTLILLLSDVLNKINTGEKFRTTLFWIAFFILSTKLRRILKIF